MAELGYSVEAQNVLEAMAIHNAHELLAVDRVRFRYLRGVGDRIRKEIRLKAKALAAIRPDLVQGRPTLHEADDDSAADWRDQRQRAGGAVAAAPAGRRRPCRRSRPGDLPRPRRGRGLDAMDTAGRRRQGAGDRPQRRVRRLAESP
jgi:hypothetical protein